MRYTKKTIFCSFSLFVALMCFASIVMGEIIFQDNFDNDPDWHQLGERDSCSNIHCENPAPGQWSYYNDDELWHPNKYPNKHATSNIDSTHHLGKFGKAFTQWQESHDGRAGDGWGNDGMLIKYLGKEFQDIYVEFWIQFDPNYQWKYTENQGSGFKLLRIYRWDG